MPVLVRRAAAADFAAIAGLRIAVYVGEGYSRPEQAAALGDVAAHAGAGDLLVAEWEPGGTLAGTVLLVGGESAHARLASAGEAEVRLLATRPEDRGRGVATALMERCLGLARDARRERLVLWTQPTMLAARRMYARLGFVRAPARDRPGPTGRPFLVYELALGTAGVSP